MAVVDSFTGTVGLRGEAELTVLDEHTAAAASGGKLPRVLSTPRLVQLVEDACYSLASRYLQDGYTSVGYEIVVEHIAPSQVGDTLTAEVLLEAAEDRDLIFRVTVRDKGSIREVARATQTRRIVLMEDFMRRVAQHRARVD